MLTPLTARGHLREEQAGDAGHAAGHQGRHVRRQGEMILYKIQ